MAAGICPLACWSVLGGNLDADATLDAAGASDASIEPEAGVDADENAPPIDGPLPLESASDAADSSKASPDAESRPPIDAGGDAPMDAPFDAGADAALDATFDAPTDADSDTSADSAPGDDGGTDAAWTVSEFSTPDVPLQFVIGPDGKLWYAAQGAIGAVTLDGVSTTWPTPTVGAWATGIALGPDGNLWFAENYPNNLGVIAPAGVMTEFPIPGGDGPYGITLGPDGNLWFTERDGNCIAKLTNPAAYAQFPLATAYTAYPLPEKWSFPEWIVAGPDGNLWFTEFGTGKIGQITTSGAITEFSIPGTLPDGGSSVLGGEPSGIVVGPDGNLWFTESSASKIGKMTTSGTVTEYETPTPSAFLGLIAVGPDGNLWFTEESKIGRITPDGLITEFLIPVAAGEAVAAGADGNIWFAQGAGDMGGLIGRLTL